MTHPAWLPCLVSASSPLGGKITIRIPRFQPLLLRRLVGAACCTACHSKEPRDQTPGMATPAAETPGTATPPTWSCGTSSPASPCPPNPSSWPPHFCFSRRDRSVLPKRKVKCFKRTGYMTGEYVQLKKELRVPFGGCGFSGNCLSGLANERSARQEKVRCWPEKHWLRATGEASSTLACGRFAPPQRTAHLSGTFYYLCSVLDGCSRP